MAVGVPLAGRAEAVEDFYRGRTVSVVIGYGVGGGFDLYARLLARHMGSHLPGGPMLVPQNMPGAGSLKATNYLFSVALKDGSVFGAIGRSIPLAPLLDTANAQFDARAFNWLGSAGKDVLVAVSWHTSPVKTLEDARRIELIVGSDAQSSETSQIPRLLNATLGTRFKIVTGYSIPAIALGMERGELGGQIGWSLDSLLTSHGDWVRDGKVNLLLQTGFTKDHRFPNVPLAIEHASSDSDRQLLGLIFSMEEMARPYVAPPGVPAERVKALSTAFMATVKDPEYRADAERSKLDIQPASAEEVTMLIDKAFATPAAVIARAREILNVAK
jgi:tripartite-type tricarboxylate transporter receptor subunit TctC